MSLLWGRGTGLKLDPVKCVAHPDAQSVNATAPILARVPFSRPLAYALT